MRRYHIAKALRLGAGACAPYELRVDVEGMDMAGGADALGEFDCRMARAAAKVSDHMALADPRGGVEALGCGRPLIHRLVAFHALGIDVEPMLLKAARVRHDGSAVRSVSLLQRPRRVHDTGLRVSGRRQPGSCTRPA